MTDSSPSLELGHDPFDLFLKSINPFTCTEPPNNFSEHRMVGTSLSIVYFSVTPHGMAAIFYSECLLQDKPVTHSKYKFLEKCRERNGKAGARRVQLVAVSISEKECNF